MEAQKKAEEKKANLDTRSLKEINSSTVPSKSEEPKKNPKKRAKITDYIDQEVGLTFIILYLLWIGLVGYSKPVMLQSNSCVNIL